MDPRTPSEVEATGTLPLTGEGSVPLTEEAAEAAASARPEWVDEARAGLTVPGKYLAYEDSGRRIVAPVSREWTRIGRSLSADVRFDDATVSRRHALVVSQADGVRVLDDRSLNGIYVNGARVDGRRSTTATRSPSAATRSTSSTPPPSARAAPPPRPPSASSPGLLATVSAPHGRDDRGALPQGRDRKDHDGADPGRRAAARRAVGARHRPRPAGQPVGLLRRPAPTPRRRWPTCSAATPRPPRPSTTGSSRRRRSWPRSSAPCRARWAASWCCARRSRARARATT